MRSERPEAAPPAVRAAHGPARPARPGRARARAGRGGRRPRRRRVTKAVAEQPPPGLRLDFVEQRVQRGTGDAVLVALTAFPDDDADDGDIVVLPGDTPLLRPPTLAALVRAHRRADAAATVLTARLDRPRPATAGWCGTRTAGWPASSSRPTPPTTSWPIDEINTSIYVFRRSRAGPRPAPAEPGQRPGRVLPDRHHRRAARRRLPGGSRWSSTTPWRPPGSTTAHQLARGRGRAAGPDQRAVDAPRRHHDRPRAHLRRHHGRAEPPTSSCTRAPTCRAERSSPAAPRSGPTPSWSTARSGRGAVVTATIGPQRRRSAPTPRSDPGPTCRPAPKWRPGTVTGPCFTGGSRRRDRA